MYVTKFDEKLEPYATWLAVTNTRKSCERQNNSKENQAANYLCPATRVMDWINLKNLNKTLDFQPN